MRGSMLTVVLFGLAGGTVAPAHAQQIPETSTDSIRPCADKRFRKAAADNGGRQCFESRVGWFLALDTVWAKAENRAVTIAAERFESIFGSSTGRAAIRQISGDVNESWNGQAFEAAGATTARNSTGDFDVDTHELGHHWFQKWYESNADSAELADTGSAYGTPAADWLDEAVAILMEGPDATKRRRSGLRERWQQNLLRSLQTILTMNHPSAGTSVPDDTGDKAPPQVVVQQDSSASSTLSAQLLQLVAAQLRSQPDPLGFYLQCRGLVDFVIARAGDQTVLRSIAENEAKGSDVVQWLAANGSRYGLPTTVSELDAQWRDWLAQQPYGLEP